MDVASASFRVGYEDPSYFSRDYQKLFGAPPQRDIAKLRNYAWCKWIQDPPGVIVDEHRDDPFDNLILPGHLRFRVVCTFSKIGTN